jgi:hypothetical protein
VNGTEVAQDVLTGTPTTGPVNSSDLWNPSVQTAAGATYRLLFTFNQPVLVSSITFASYGDSNHDPKQLNVFTSFSSSMIQSFPTKVGYGNWQTFTLTTPVTTSTIGLEFVPNYQPNEVAIHHVSFA